MNRRLLAVLTFALLVAAATSALVYKLALANHGVTLTAATPTGKLYAASHDLQLGALISDDDVKEVSWSGSLPPQAVKNKQDLIGRGVLATIYKDEPFNGARLALRGAGAGLASTIPVGMRAVALRVNDVIGLDGFVLPGMRVDVLVAGNAPGDEVGVRCRTVLQNIAVLSAGQKITKSEDGKPQSAEVVNLLVTPDQAETLNLASSETKVQLVLRNPLDTEEKPTHGTSISSLLGSKPIVAGAAPVAYARAKPTAALQHAPTVEMFNGNKRSEQVLVSTMGKGQ